MAIDAAGACNILITTSTLALSYNVVHSLMIHKTSAVTTTVLGQVKIIGVIVTSALVLGEWQLQLKCALSI